MLKWLSLPKVSQKKLSERNAELIQQLTQICYFFPPEVLHTLLNKQLRDKHIAQVVMLK